VASEELHSVKRIIAEDRARAGLTPDFYDVRAARASLPESRLPLPAGIRIRQLVTYGTTCFRLSTPESDPSRVIVYLHGGGFLAGGFHSHRPLAAWLAHHAGATVLFPEYRLAPEHRFPAGAEDCFAAYCHALETDDEETGGKPRFLAVAGDSAGGALAAGIVLRAHAAGLRNPDALAILCGMLDLDEATSRFLELSQRSRDGVRLYVSCLKDLRDPLASPILADLGGFPPTFVQTGAEDYCADENRRFADKAREAGVDVVFEEWPAMIHVWHRFAPLLPEAVAALHRIGAWLGEIAAAGAVARPITAG
jgi:monoterpene epsilon-lactone hydrolase